MTSFLLPEVERINMRENVKRNQRENLLAAHKEIYGLANQMMDTLDKTASDGGGSGGGGQS